MTQQTGEVPHQLVEVHPRCDECSDDHISLRCSGTYYIWFDHFIYLGMLKVPIVQCDRVRKVRAALFALAHQKRRVEVNAVRPLAVASRYPSA